MKKTLTLMLLLFAVFLSTAAAYTDSFAATNSNPLFNELITALKNEEKEDIVLPLYDKYISSSITNVERSRIEYHMARYYKDTKQKDKAKTHVELEADYMNKIEDTATDLEKLVAEVDYTSARYYVTRELSIGMENSNLSKKLYAEYPNEFYAALTECWRLIYTPAIAGGSYRKAVKLLLDIEKNKEGISYLEEAGLYSALGYASYMRDEYNDAERYLNKAKTFYKKDPLVLETMKEVQEKLRGN